MTAFFCGSELAFIAAESKRYGSMFPILHTSLRNANGSEA
jgi:hypothetical protein